MSRETYSSGWSPDDTVDYTIDDADDPSSFAASYGQATSPAGAQYFGEFIQPSSITDGTISSFQSSQLPSDSLYENGPWSDHSNFNSPGPVSSVDLGYQNL
jgi:hypothetical protein